MADGTLTVDVAGAGPFANDGTLAVANGGTLRVVGDLAGSATAVLSGSGTIVASGDDIDHAGLIGPGSSPGLLNIDANLSLQATADLAVELAGTAPGTEFDVLAVTGDLVLGGELSLSLLEGFTPSLTDTFEIVTAASTTGVFSNVADGGTLLTEDGLGSFTVNINSNSVVLGGFEVVPEPGTLALVGLSGLALLRRRRA